MAKARGITSGLLIILLGGTAAGQTALEGPLAAPPAVSPSTTKKAPRQASHKAHAAAHKTSKDVSVTEPTSRAVPSVARSTSLPDDPLSFGMKWNGSNDSARETRIQNYNGTASGSGAEVGLKMHF